MRVLALCLLSSLAGFGCVHIIKSPQEVQREEREREQAESDRRDRVRAEKRAAEAEERRQLAANRTAFVAQANASREDFRQDVETKRVAACDIDRLERLAAMEQAIVIRRERERRAEWLTTHCHVEDRSKPVIRTVQNPNGTLTTYEGRDRGVDTVCDAKRPEDMSAPLHREPDVHDTKTVPVPGSTLHPDDTTRLVSCRSLDVESSDTAREYYQR